MNNLATHTQSRFPIEIEVYVNPDGSVTFADLEAGAISIAQSLTDLPIMCDVPAPTSAAKDDPVIQKSTYKPLSGRLKP
jgi:hypothetical protein